jgi:hypothetical protein
MGKLFDSLNFNFDRSKLGDAIDPEQNIEVGVRRSIPLIPKWQYDAIANNEVSNTLYVKNPVANVAQTIRDTANSISSVSIAGGTISSIRSAANQIAGFLTNVGTEESPVYEYTLGSAERFINHTNRISGVVETTDQNLPDFYTAVGMGQLVFSIVSKYENITDNTPILGSLTSLFIGPDLETRLNLLIPTIVEIQESITVDSGTGTEEDPFVYTTNLSETRQDQILDLVSSTDTLLTERRTHDVNFFLKCKEINDNYTRLGKFGNFSALTLHIIENYTGTDKLKSKL